MKLYCGVYGEGSVFSVEIQSDANVEALQNVIFDNQRYRERFQFPPSALTLYVARKKKKGKARKWLKHDYSVEKMLRGKIDTTYKKMLSSWKLNKTEYFGDFELGEEEIHILVELPDARDAELQELLLRHELMDAPSSTSAPSSRGNQFRAVLCARYNCDKGNGYVRCMLLNTTLPSPLVIASHIFPRSKGYLSEKLLGFSDIDDERNGLLLFKPLEYAFDHFQISFIYDQGSEAFRLKVFDPSLRSQRLFEKLDAKHSAILLQNQTLPIDWESQGRILAPGTDYDIQTTFGDLEVAPSSLCFQTLDRPYKRCLNVQARLARKKAIENNWIQPEECQFEDFWSEGMSLVEKMEFFYARQPN
jgi:hypothetical protein